MSYFEIFKREIIKHSVAQTYFEACAEWEEVGINYADDHEDCECICTHPIKQLITIRNRENNNELVVGSEQSFDLRLLITRFGVFMCDEKDTSQ